MGCRVCRARKVKCDGRPDGCRNCERLQLDCDDGCRGGGNDSLRRMRTYRSCQNCRLSKTKCSGSRPRCTRCVAKDMDCLYDGEASPRWASSLGRRDEDASLPVADGPESPVVPVPESESPAAAPDPRRGAAPEPDDKVENQLSWLLSPELPTGRNVRRVVEQYFVNVHPLRCFAFVHKPSFMHQLDKGLGSDDESALLHIVCAHGARFLVLGHCLDGHVATPALVRSAGHQWAKRAEFLMLANFGRISMPRLMVAILLHDYYLGAGEYGQALMLSGLAVRMAYALKINQEYNADVLCSEPEPEPGAPSVASRESRRRLMWACYVLDAGAGSGADLLRESDIKIQLPCNERNFGLRIPAVTETLAVGHVLQFLAPAVVPRRPAANMGIMAYYIRLVALWKRIVRCAGLGLGHGQPDSALAALDADLLLWRRELPDFVEYSTETIYARLDSNQLGALVLIHCTYHHNHLELYRVAMPDLFKLASLPAEQRQALQAAQAGCYHHARRISDIVTDAAEHGVRFLSDSQLPFFLYHSSRVMLYYVARLLDPARPGAEAKMREAVEAVESNSRVLRLMAILFPMAQSLSATTDRWLSKVQQTVGRDELVLLPPLSPPRPGAGDESESRPAGWSTVNPNAGGWDGTSPGPPSGPRRASCSLEHERPVAALCEALDLDDLLSWDLYGISTEMGEGVCNDEMDDCVSQSWTGAI
ncbi:hypothetical protein XA68_18345 [Ophiocordyceps unilateralis]|uniref:Zn(2)-C6 fungal-type domain-containing protein n=1 Tax=Ophiocordyceps unilateralis TaxID=268505 RepID=A0A2A9P3I9_OPHUN|nr:hypothetical protein XA68_18345 [Ophiocordyceps unilateralis]